MLRVNTLKGQHPHRRFLTNAQSFFQDLTRTRFLSNVHYLNVNFLGNDLIYSHPKRSGMTTSPYYDVRTKYDHASKRWLIQVQ